MDISVENAIYIICHVTIRSPYVVLGVRLFILKKGWVFGRFFFIRFLFTAVEGQNVAQAACRLV